MGMPVRALRCRWSLAAPVPAPGRAATPAVLYSFDGKSGKQLWTSGKAMKAPASPGSFWTALSQIYVGNTDGTLNAFGFLDERR